MSIGGLIAYMLTVQMLVKVVFFFFLSLSIGTIMEALFHWKSAPTRNLELIFLLHSLLFCKMALRCHTYSSKAGHTRMKVFLDTGWSSLF
jgi:hypothetical protein